jgi:hypothetical protein
MKRHIAGLQGEARHEGNLLEGVFLVRVDGARYCWHPQKPFFSIHLAILEPKELASRNISGRLYCTPKALWRLNWFLRDFGYDPDLFGREEVDEKVLLGLRGVVRTVRKTFARGSYLNLDSFAPSGEWEAISADRHPRALDQREGSSDDLQLHTD